MDYTTLPSNQLPTLDAESLPLMSLYQALQELPDTRRAQGKRYELALILCLLLLAKLAGQKSLSGATQWLRHRRVTLAQRFGLSRPCLPCQTTYCNVLTRVDGSPSTALCPRFFSGGKHKAVVERNLVGC